jgi:hypothetical protein
MSSPLYIVRASTDGVLTGLSIPLLSGNHASHRPLLDALLRAMHRAVSPPAFVNPPPAINSPLYTVKADTHAFIPIPKGGCHAVPFHRAIFPATWLPATPK